MKHMTLYDNIMKLRVKNRYTYDQVGKALGMKKGVFASKMNRLKKGSRTAVTAGDVARMIRLFNCTADDIFKGVA